MNSATIPSVYVGTYHKYNCGSIQGDWVDLTEFDNQTDFYQACCRMLHSDEAEPELMFQDWEGIPRTVSSESSIDWTYIAVFKQVHDNGHDEAYVTWVEYTGETDYDAFQDAYCGLAESEEEYAIDHVEEHGGT